MAITPTVAHLYGGRRTSEIGAPVRQGLWIGLVSALSIGAVLLSTQLRRISRRHILAAQVQEPVAVS